MGEDDVWLSADLGGPLPPYELSLGMAGPTIPLYQSGSVVQWYTLAGVKAAGRYLRATIPTGVYVFADEIQVWGGTGIIAGAIQTGGWSGKATARSLEGFAVGEKRQPGVKLLAAGVPPA